MSTAPSTRVPGMMSFIRFSVRRNVLLPQPDGPMNAVTTFGWMPMRDVLERALRAVVEVQVADVDLDGGRVGAGGRGGASDGDRDARERVCADAMPTSTATGRAVSRAVSGAVNSV